MRRLVLLALMSIPVMGFAQDDLYFTPSKKQKVVEQVRVERVAPVTPVDYNSCTRSEDEYNRRYSYKGSYQTGGGADLYFNGDSLTATIDTVGVDAGYDNAYDMDDPELDYRYSRRILRFHNPRYYALGSPYYWDVVYHWGAWDYVYHPYDPWYGYYGWGYGWSWGPWDCWWGGIWGWHHPYHWDTWGWGPTWGGPGHHIAINHYPRTGQNRGNISPRGHMAAGNRIRTSAIASNRGTAGSRTSAIAANRGYQGRTSIGRSEAGNVATRGSYSGYTAQRQGVTTAPTRTSANRYGQRGNATSYGNSNSSARTGNYSPSTTRSSANANSSSRSTYSNSNNSSYNSRSTSSYSSPSYSSGSRGGGSFGRGGGSFGGGGGPRGGGGGRR